MPSLFVAFNEQNVRYGNSRWLFSGPRAMRFEWLALLALRRLSAPWDKGAVTAEEVSRLPTWLGRSHHHVVTNVGRYLQSFRRSGIRIVDTGSPWSGPYQLSIKGRDIAFDVSQAEAARRLGIQSSLANPEPLAFPRFALLFASAQWLLYQGRLATAGPRRQFQEGAYGRLVRIVEDQSYGPKLRAIAWLAAVHALFQMGRFELARKTLAGYSHLLAQVRDEVLSARYWLALAWSHQRGATGRESDRNTLTALRNAAKHVGRTLDRESLAALSYRRSGYLTKHGQHAEAVAELERALEGHLVSGHFQNAQACCVDIGSDLHRRGAEHYGTARYWILVGLSICRLMEIGRDNTHGEAILGKIYVEQGKKLMSRLWVDRALRVASDARSMVSLGDAHMIMALWHQRFGQDTQTVNSIVQALTVFRSLKHFDCAQKEAYMKRKFPELWRRAVSKVVPHRQLQTGSVQRIKSSKRSRDSE